MPNFFHAVGPVAPAGVNTATEDCRSRRPNRCRSEYSSGIVDASPISTGVAVALLAPAMQTRFGSTMPWCHGEPTSRRRPRRPAWPGPHCLPAGAKQLLAVAGAAAEFGRSSTGSARLGEEACTSAVPVPRCAALRTCRPPLAPAPPAPWQVLALGAVQESSGRRVSETVACGVVDLAPSSAIFFGSMSGARCRRHDQLVFAHVVHGSTGPAPMVGERMDDQRKWPSPRAAPCRCGCRSTAAACRTLACRASRLGTGSAASLRRRRRSAVARPACPAAT